QPEWKRMLEEAGLKTAVLRAAPNKREGWVEKQVAAGVNVIISHPKKVETGIDLLDFPTIVWMSPHYSVYTVLQASRRSWRIGQTKPVKVYYFAYANTIQEQALYLVAAKVAAAQHVNGDTVADGNGHGTGLSELNGIAGNDIVATLARIVTGDVEVNTQSLQQAFAKANASLRQANNVIGGYEMVDDEEVEPVTAVTVNGHRLQSPLPLIKRPVEIGVGQQSSLFGDGSNGQVNSLPPRSACPREGVGRGGQLNGNGHIGRNGQHSKNGHANDNNPEDEANEKQPPIPRPRLLIDQLAGRS
ncbi:MAG: hypothetical protein GY805_23715, partial [Chloroflexi bacterium]|nr:hypothetical protein [Chloroflexota bacterium]